MDPSELFNHIFRDMNINQGNPFVNMPGFPVNFNNPGFNNNVMRSSSIFFIINNNNNNIIIYKIILISILLIHLING